MYNRFGIVFLVFIFVIFISCDKNKVKIEEYYKGYFLKLINFLNKKVYFLFNYIKVNLNELGEMLR